MKNLICRRCKQGASELMLDALMLEAGAKMSHSPLHCDGENQHEFVDINTHKCENCQKKFADCDGNPTFSIDLDSRLVGAEADKVVHCEGYYGR